MKKICLLFLFSVSFIHFVYSQTDYWPGVVHLDNGDSLTGKLFYGSSKFNSEKCLFRQDGKGTRVFYPQDIQSYRFDGASFFVSRKIDFNGQGKDVFLEWLIKGKLNLYLYADSMNSIRYFIEKEGDVLHELHNTKKEVEFSSYTITKDQREYVKELISLLQDTPDLFSEIQKSNFDFKSLIRIAKEYHNRVCTNEECIVFERPRRKIVLTVGLVGEYFTSQVNMTDVLNIGDPSIDTGKMKQTSSIAGGITVDVSNFNFVSPRFSLGAELVRMNSDYVNIIGDTLLSFNQFRSSIQFKYSIPIQKFKANFSLGASSYWRGDNKYADRQWYKEYANSLFKFAFFDNSLVSHYQLGFNGKVGAEYDLTDRINLALSFRYEYCPQFMGGYVGDPSYCHNFSAQFGVGYRFRR